MNIPEGQLARFFGKTEVTYDTVQAFVAGDGMGLDDLKIEPTPFYNPTKERVGTASEQAMTAGVKGGKWSAISAVKPQTAGTAPDVGELIKAALGVETDGASDVIYSLSDTVRNSLQMARHVGDGLYEVATGCAVEQLDIECQGGADPKLTFSGFFATYGWVYGTTVVNNESSSATQIEYNASHPGNLGVNGRVKFGTEDNSGAGYLITAVNQTANPPHITISPGLANGVSEGAVIAPFTPTPSLGGTIIGGQSCGLTVDAVATGFVGLTMSVKTGHHARDKEATATRPTGIIGGKREITGELTVYFKDTENGKILGRAWDGTTRALIIRLGPDVAGSRMKISVPKAFVEVTPIEVPESGEAMAKIKFRALMNSAAADELVITFD